MGEERDGLITWTFYMRVESEMDSSPGHSTCGWGARWTHHLDILHVGEERDGIITWTFYLWVRSKMDSSPGHSTCG